MVNRPDYHGLRLRAGFTGWLAVLLATMNALEAPRQLIDPATWGPPEMRAVLAVRDITGLYRLLQRYGFSQQRIAAMTGQSQPEVSAIMHGRKVMAYDVLVRIADGLGVPRGLMGLAFAPELQAG